MEIFIDINQNNLEEVQEMLETVPIEVRVLLQNLYQEAGVRIVERAQELAPVKTGLLRASIDFVDFEGGVTVYCTVPYASFQEYGTEFIVPRLFITTAIEEIMPQVEAEAERIIKEYLVGYATEIKEREPKVCKALHDVGIELGIRKK